MIDDAVIRQELLVRADGKLLRLNTKSRPPGEEEKSRPPGEVEEKSRPPSEEIEKLDTISFEKGD